MTSTSEPPYYRRLFSLGHWLMAGGFIALLIAGQQFNFDLSKAYRIHGLKLHSGTGLFVLILAITLMTRRWIGNEPRPSIDLPPLKKLAAHVIQCLLYGLAVFVPLSGLATALVSPTPTVVFGLVDLSRFTQNPELYAGIRFIHEFATWMAAALISAHAGAALYHHLVLKDDVLRAMLNVPALKRRWVVVKSLRQGKTDTER